MGAEKKQNKKSTTLSSVAVAGESWFLKKHERNVPRECFSLSQKQKGKNQRASVWKSCPVLPEGCTQHTYPACGSVVQHHFTHHRQTRLLANSVTFPLHHFSSTSPPVPQLQLPGVVGGGGAVGTLQHALKVYIKHGSSSQILFIFYCIHKYLERSESGRLRYVISMSSLSEKKGGGAEW